jgi:hypothetical protein
MDPFLESFYETFLISEDDKSTLRDRHQITSYTNLMEKQEQMMFGKLEDVSERAQTILAVAMLPSRKDGVDGNPLQRFQMDNNFLNFLCNDDIQEHDSDDEVNAFVEVTSSDDEEIASIVSSSDGDRPRASQR